MSEIPLEKKLASLRKLLVYRPPLVVGVVLTSSGAALFEGIGLTLLLPVLQIAERGAASADGNQYLEGLITLYDFFGVPFVLEYILLGMVVVMFLRYTLTFLVSWLRAILSLNYVSHLKAETFERVLSARISYFDEKPLDEILNANITQAKNANNVITPLVSLIKTTFISLMYLAVAFVIAPMATVTVMTLLFVFVFVVRSAFETGYEVGDRLAEANERLQESVQAGAQGVREIKVFNMQSEMFDRFTESLSVYKAAGIRVARNDAAVNNLYSFGVSVTVFGLVYFILEFTPLSIASIGVFLFAMFRLTPRASSINRMLYNLDSKLPHLVRAHEFIDELEAHKDATEGSENVPTPVGEVAFEGIDFSYGDDSVLHDVTFSIERGDFVAFVGPSGTGKSTIISLLAGLYAPEAGRITANGTPIHRFDKNEWWDTISLVRQKPHIFNATLRENLTIGWRDATEEQVREAAELACVDEFAHELADGYDTNVGDDGVKLSGGQRQRVAIARAILEDADIVLFDEATSDLDAALEEQIHQNITELGRNKIFVVVAHRLSTVRDAARIYTVQDGSICATGTHTQLLERGGTYAELYSTQS